MAEEYRINIMEDQVVSPTQESQEEGLKTAGVMERFVALLIDFGVVLFFYQIFLFFVFKFSYPSLEQIYALCFGVFVPFVLYEAVFSCGGRNSLGKKLVGITVVNVHTGEPLSFLRALVRSVGYVFSGALLMCGCMIIFLVLS